jgi:hypothetical protein
LHPVFGGSQSLLSWLPVSIGRQTIFVTVCIALVAGVLLLTTWLQELCGGDVTLLLALLTVLMVTRPQHHVTENFLVRCHISNNDNRL